MEAKIGQVNVLSVKNGISETGQRGRLVKIVGFSATASSIGSTPSVGVSPLVSIPRLAKTVYG